MLTACAMNVLQMYPNVARRADSEVNVHVSIPFGVDG